jgi:hypothetical protein
LVTHNHAAPPATPAAVTVARAPAAAPSPVPAGLSATEKYHQILLDEYEKQQKEAARYREIMRRRTAALKAQEQNHEPLWKPLTNH